MTKEDAIKHLENMKWLLGVNNTTVDDIPLTKVIDDIAALLKSQEPRLVEPTDFEKADDYNWLPAWCEERTGAGYWEMILPDALDEKDVRYWTGRPTDEQREMTPWQIQS